MIYDEAYCYMNSVLLQLYRNLYLIEDKMLSVIVFGTNVLVNLMVFVETHLKGWIKITDLVYGNETLQLVIIILNVLYNHYQTTDHPLKYIILRNYKKEFKLKNLSQWFDSIDFYPLKDIKINYKENIKMINIYQNTLSHQRWLDMFCSNQDCRKIRREHTLKKCRQCKMVRYCSRKCQKQDWINHKEICKKLRKMKRNSQDLKHEQIAYDDVIYNFSVKNN
mmetsp:Transcript_69702/g.85482  ORF Transcript_69702/g.85482 Transcript_69702/m.85482 type:complete len:222 (+) Transcript_69702:3-668(+)